MSNTPSTAHASRGSTRTVRPHLAPGLLMCLGAAGLSCAITAMVPVMSPLLIAIIAGTAVANLTRLPARTSAGIDFAAKRLLRVGIALLGLQLVFSDIVNLGLPMLAVVVLVVGVGVGGTLFFGRLLRTSRQLTLLVACGFSICGAAAVAGAAGVSDPDGKHEEDTVTAIALVVICGTLMIPVIPLLAGLLGWHPEQGGLWAGGAIHEIAQVVAAGGILGSSALAIAVIVKLARVLLLAPVMMVLSIYQRRTSAVLAHSTEHNCSQRPPLVPMFVIGFLAMVAMRSLMSLPEYVVTAGAILQTMLLAAAMFALGCGVNVRNLVRVGLRPFALAGASTVLVAVIAFTGVALVA